MAGTPHKRRGARNVSLCSFYGRMGNPRRVVSGILTVIVRNQEGTDDGYWDTGVDDYVSKVEDDLGGGSPSLTVQEMVKSSPFWFPDINDSNTDIIHLDKATAQGGYAEYDEDGVSIPWNHGWDRWSGIGAKKAVGDYDCFLYHLTMGVNLQEEVLMYSTESFGINGFAALPSMYTNVGAGFAGSYKNVELYFAGCVSAYVDLDLVYVTVSLGIYEYSVTITNIHYGGHFPIGVAANQCTVNWVNVIPGLGPLPNTDTWTINSYAECMYEGAHSIEWMDDQEDHPPLNSPGAGPYSGVGYSNQTNWTQSTADPDEWYDVIDHKYCQSFVKWTLLSRHNNAYDHHDWSPYNRHLDMENGTEMDRSEILWRHLNTGGETYAPNDGDDAGDVGTSGSSFGDYYHYGATVNGQDARGEIAYPLGMIERDEYCYYGDYSQTRWGDWMDDGAGDTDRGYYRADDHNDFRQGLTHRRKYIFNTGTSSWHEDSLGNDLSIYADPRRDHSPDIDFLKKAREGYNKFWTPIHRIDIFATHPLIKDINTLTYDLETPMGDHESPPGTPMTEDISHTVSMYKSRSGATHDIDFYNLVVDIQSASYSSDSTYPVGTNPNDEYTAYYNRTQVLFQAFGETSNIRLTMTEPTA